VRRCSSQWWSVVAADVRLGNSLQNSCAARVCASGSGRASGRGLLRARPVGFTASMHARARHCDIGDWGKWPNRQDPLGGDAKREMRADD
jgi:hypothetical protein